MTGRLTQHPLWRSLDGSTRRLLADWTCPVRWHGRAQLKQLAADDLVIGYAATGHVLTINAAQVLGAATAQVPPPDAAGHGWRIPAAMLQPLLEGQDACRQHLEQACHTPSQAVKPVSAEGSSPSFSTSLTLGWLLAVAVPLVAVLWLGQRTDALAQWLFFLAALASGLCVWVLGLAPPFVGALMARVLMVVGSHVPTSLAFAGFASGSFFLLLGMLGISAAVQRSGLVERLLVLGLRYLPHTPRTLQAGLALVGGLMSMFIPSTSGRLQLIAPMVNTVASPGNKAALAFAALSGCTLFSTAFLLGNAGNFIVLGILPAHWQEHINWTTWFKGAGVYVLVLGSLLGITLFGQGRAGAPSAPQVAPLRAPSRALSANEMITGLALGCLTLGLAFGNVHRIETAWLALFVFLLLIASGVLSLDNLRRDIHWPILIYLVCTVGFARGFTYTGIDAWIGSHLGALAVLIQTAQVQFLLLLMVVVLLLRLMLPAVVCVTTLCVVFVPLADAYNLNPWVVGFVALTASEVWFFPHQSTDYLLFRESTQLADCERAHLLRANARIQCCRILALAASIPYWQYLGYVR